MALPYMGNTGNTVINNAITAIKKSTGLIAPTEAEIEANSSDDGSESNTNKDGTNRQARRLKKKISKNNNP